MKDIQDIVKKINNDIAQREKLNPAAVYEQLKDTYPIVLTMEPCYDYEIPVLSGQSAAGRFELWDNGLDIIFEIERNDGSNTQWHPSDVNEAVEDVQNFMQGKCKF